MSFEFSLVRGWPLLLTALALPACQAMVNVDDYTFHARPGEDGAASGAADAGFGGGPGEAGTGSGSAGSGGVGGNGAGGAALGPLPGSAGSGSEPRPGVEPLRPPDAGAPGEVPLAPGVAALESLPAPSEDGFLRPAEVLVAGAALASRNGFIELRLERDGLTVTHQQVDGSRQVAAAFPIADAHVATLGEGGHFVVYARDGSITDLSSGAGSIDAPVLRVQNDGNVVLYDNDAALPRGVHWTSNTNFRRVAGACRRLEPNQAIYPGGSVPSCNGLFRLVLDAEGRLSVLDGQDFPLFQSTAGGPASAAIMQWDGNLVVYDVNDSPRWDTATYPVPGAYAAVEDDGTLAVFDPNDALIWPPAE